MFKRLLHYYKPHKKLFFLDFGSAFLTALMDLFFPAIVSYSINTVLPMKNAGLFAKMMGLLLVFYVVRFVTNYIVHYI